MLTITVLLMLLLLLLLVMLLLVVVVGGVSDGIVNNVLHSLATILSVNNSQRITICHFTADPNLMLTGGVWSTSYLSHKCQNANKQNKTELESSEKNSPLHNQYNSKFGYIKISFLKNSRFSRLEIVKGTEVKRKIT